MKNVESNFLMDIAKIEQIPIVSTMLEVICRTTGMGFAAIARVTEDRWIACSVRDEISFGLKTGGELPIETTICNEIRQRHETVIIDDVDQDPHFAQHHTPRIYGFKSYISVPIILKNGEFFGTLCAIDPKPAALNNIKISGMFNMFVDLIAFHLQSIESVEKSRQMLSEVNHQLADSIDINNQFLFISNHNLQEPLRKIRVFSGMLVDAAEQSDFEKVKTYAGRVEACAVQFSALITEISEFSESHKETTFESTDLNKVVTEVMDLLSPLLNDKKTKVERDNLPTIIANRFQMEQLFRNLITNSIQFAKQPNEHRIYITAKTSEPEELGKQPTVEILIEDNGKGFSESHLHKIFDIFPQFPDYKNGQTEGHSLAYCRKIVSNHGGRIKATSVEGNGTIFSITLPAQKLAFK